MMTFPANFGVPGTDIAPDATPGRDLRADVRVPPSSPLGGVDAGTRTSVGANELHRLSVGNDGRLFWDDKPVLVRRRLVLTFWQKLGAILIGLAALTIALSAVVHASIAAHEWMCGARWVTGYCPGAAPPAPATPPKPALPELPT